MDLPGSLQWPAMVTTTYASWLVASRLPQRRAAGFWWFLVSNILWSIWGWHADAYALVALQAALAAMNIRGLRKTEPAANTELGHGKV